MIIVGWLLLDNLWICLGFCVTMAIGSSSRSYERSWKYYCAAYSHRFEQGLSRKEVLTIYKWCDVWILKTIYDDYLYSQFVCQREEIVEKKVKDFNECISSKISLSSSINFWGL